MIGLKKKTAMTQGETEDKISPGQLQFKNELPTLMMIPQCKLSTNPKDIMNFTAIYTPDKDSLWYGGRYEFSFAIPDDYPYSPPKVLCNTMIYHPNIDLKGNVCLNILRKEWTAVLNVSTVIVGVYFLFTEPNPNDPLNHDAAEIMRDNPEQFVLNVKKSLKGGKMFGEEFLKFI